MITRFLICLTCCVLSTSSINELAAQVFRDDRPESTMGSDLRAIIDEQAELRRELRSLEQEKVQISRRIAKLDQLAEIQRELNHLLEQINQARESGERQQIARLESRISPLKNHLRDLRKQLDARAEIDEQLHELRNLALQIQQIPSNKESSRWASAVKSVISKIERRQQLHIELNQNGLETSGSLREKIEEQIDQLGEQIDEEYELIEMVHQFLEAREEFGQPRTQELETEITEFVSELKDRRSSTTGPNPETTNQNEQERLVSGERFITQSWSQESRYRRPYHVRVPQYGTEQQKLPVLIFLHGNGGNAKNAMRNFVRNRSKITNRYIMVFAQGYRESWNIVSERSKADDVGFIEAIVLKLAKYQNVDSNDFSIMGSSNGSALINQLAIESKLPNIRNYISGVSPLNVWQHDGTSFKAKGIDNNYKSVANPMTGKRLMNISGTDDKLVPYWGGPSPVIPAKNGKLAFLPSEESTFIWAQQMGYTGKKRIRPSRTISNIEIFEYLDGDVIHCKVNRAGHNATHEVSEAMLLEFLQDD